MNGEWFYVCTFNLDTASFCENLSRYFMWSKKLLFVMTITLYMCACNILNIPKSSDISSWDLLGLLQTPIFSLWNSHFPKGITIVQIYLDTGFNSMWYYLMLKSKGDAFVTPYIFSSISCSLEIRNDFLKILWFSFLKLDKNLTVPLFLVG